MAGRVGEVEALNPEEREYAMVRQRRQHTVNFMCPAFMDRQV